MAKNIKISPEEQKSYQLQCEMNDIEKKIRKGIIPKNPTRIFNIGDSVKWGNHENVTVSEVLFDGLAYYLHFDYMTESHGRPVNTIENHIVFWFDIFPITSFCEGKRMSCVDDVRIDYYNNDISSLIHKVYSAGVNFNPSYQRDLVWTIEQKVALIDSIFNNVDIGKFTFIKLDYSADLYYEILDGKQRLTTICEFYEDRFEYNGKKYSQLCYSDSHHFTRYPIIQGEVSNLTQNQIYKLFLKMNTSGTPVSKEHLESIKSLITE